MLRPDVLRDSRDFKKLYKKGKSVPGKYMVVIHLGNGLEFNRYAFLASKKVGNSVKRNRARRLMKEGLRGQRDDLKPGNDILFIARNGIAEAAFAEVTDSMNKALVRSGLYK